MEWTTKKDHQRPGTGEACAITWGGGQGKKGRRTELFSSTKSRGQTEREHRRALQGQNKAGIPALMTTYEKRLGKGEKGGPKKETRNTNKPLEQEGENESKDTAQQKKGTKSGGKLNCQKSPKIENLELYGGNQEQPGKRGKKKNHGLVVGKEKGEMEDTLKNRQENLPTDYWESGKKKKKNHISRGKTTLKAKKKW